MTWARPESAVQIIRAVCLIVLLANSCPGAPGFALKEEAKEESRPGDYAVVRFGFKETRFDLRETSDLVRLEENLKEALKTEDADEGSTADSGSAKHRRRGLREALELVGELRKCHQAAEAQQLHRSLEEIFAALLNLERPPVPRAVDFFETPVAFLKRFSRPIGEGRTPAANVAVINGSDLSQADPAPSSFWHPPGAVAGKDLFHGFGRTNLLLGGEPVCEYSAPKESFGRNPGFEVEYEGQRLKLKFAEISSEPFAARIFDALGFNTDPTDYAARVKVRYTRRIFEEFNRRKPLQTHFTFMGFVPLFTLRLQQHYDPFQYVKAAVLKDGTRWSGAELKRQVLRDPARAEIEATNYRAEVEARIDYIETAPASVQSRRGKNIGPWDFGDLDHAARRELRGAGLLAGWLGWFDTRFDNTRLRIVERPEGRRLEHYFSDLGGILGETKGLLYARGELPNAFPWSFTHPSLWQGPHHLSRPLRLAGYKPVAKAAAFAEMTIDDARWMARRIGQLRAEQIEEALVASGFDSAQVRLYLAKLVSRRNKMIADLGLGREIPAIHGCGENGHLDYEPTRDGPVRVRVENELITAPAGTHYVANGKLLSRRDAPEPADEKRRARQFTFPFKSP